MVRGSVSERRGFVPFLFERFAGQVVPKKATLRLRAETTQPRRKSAGATFRGGRVSEDTEHAPTDRSHRGRSDETRDVVVGADSPGRKN
jgi:hypothetical protein